MKRPLVILNALLAALGLGLAVWCVVALLSTPYGGMRAPAYLILFVVTWIGSNRGLALWQQFTAPGPTRTVLRVAKWLLPFVLPLVMIPAVERGVQSRQVALATKELASVSKYADAQGQGGFDAALAPAPRFPVDVHYRDEEQGYALWLRAPSVDIDGATLRYDPNSGTWQRRHDEQPEFDASVQGRCILKDAAWRCADLPATERAAD